MTKTCPNCGEQKDVSLFPRNKRKKDGFDLHCKACTNERFRERYAHDPTVRAQKIEKTRKYHADNPEWSKERLRAHHVANRAVRADRALVRGLDPVVQKQRRDSTRRAELRRRAVKAASSVVDSISQKDLDCLLIEYGNACWICESLFGENVVLHWDHIRPLAKQGTHTLDNLAPACDLCNVRKNAVWPFTERRRSEIKTEVLALRALAHGSEVNATP